MAKVKEDAGDNPWNIDAGLAYLIKGPALRLIANYSTPTFGPTTINGLTSPPRRSSLIRNLLNVDPNQSSLPPTKTIVNGRFITCSRNQQWSLLAGR